MKCTQRAAIHIMLKLFTVIGARPQLIKAAAVSQAIAKYPDDIEEKIFHTGQHYDKNMSDIFLTQLNIPKPHFHLDLNQSKDDSKLTMMLTELERAITESKPDLVLTYGDTNSTLAAATAATKLKVPLAHVEAGLRSFNNAMPEEKNRILTDRASKYLFCPTQTAVDHLRKEDITNNSQTHVQLVGDVMYDLALKLQKNLPEAPPKLFKNPSLPCAVMTLHRQSNVDDAKKLEAIIEAVAKSLPEHDIIFPAHPRTAKNLPKYLPKNIYRTEPTGYLEMMHMLKHCDIVLTDSGGLMKEAYFMEKPCVVLRNETEWVELVDIKAACLAGTNEKGIQESIKKMLTSPETCFSGAPFGDGKASERIVNYLIKNH